MTYLPNELLNIIFSFVERPQINNKIKKMINGYNSLLLRCESENIFRTPHTLTFAEWYFEYRFHCKFIIVIRWVYDKIHHAGRMHLYINEYNVLVKNYSFYRNTLDDDIEIDVFNSMEIISYSNPSRTVFADEMGVVYAN